MKHYGHFRISIQTFMCIMLIGRRFTDFQFAKVAIPMYVMANDMFLFFRWKSKITGNWNNCNEWPRQCVRSPENATDANFSSVLRLSFRDLWFTWFNKTLLCRRKKGTIYTLNRSNIKRTNETVIGDWMRNQSIVQTYRKQSNMGVLHYGLFAMPISIRNHDIGSGEFILLQIKNPFGIVWTLNTAQV